jgi:hypothetical protein
LSAELVVLLDGEGGVELGLNGGAGSRGVDDDDVRAEVGRVGCGGGWADGQGAGDDDNGDDAGAQSRGEAGRGW